MDDGPVRPGAPRSLSESWDPPAHARARCRGDSPPARRATYGSRSGPLGRLHVKTQCRNALHGRPVAQMRGRGGGDLGRGVPLSPSAFRQGVAGRHHLGARLHQRAPWPPRGQRLVVSTRHAAPHRRQHRPPASLDHGPSRRRGRPGCPASLSRPRRKGPGPVAPPASSPHGPAIAVVMGHRRHARGMFKQPSTGLSGLR